MTDDTRTTDPTAKPAEEDRRSLRPEERVLLLDMWQRSGPTARDFGALVGISKHTIFNWKKRFDRMGPAGLMDAPRGASTGSRLSDPTQRAILMLKEAHPEWGCERLRDVLARGEGYSASTGAIAHLLRENGYELEGVATSPHPPAVHHFERARPNQLWQSDLFTFLLKRENRRVYLVVYLDDHSRFIVGYGVWASAAGALVREVLEAAIANFGAPPEELTANGRPIL